VSSVNRAPTPGASARVRAGAVAAEVEAAGPPPAPLLAPPWSLRPVAAAGAELDRVAAWMRRPHVADRWGQDWPTAQWAGEIARQLAGDHSRPFTVSLDGEPVAYVEVYRVARDLLADYVATDPHDLGVHLAVGDADRTGRGLGRAVLGSVAEGLLAADPRCRRVVGDPEAGHGVARRAFTAAGFTLVGEVDLPHKRAAVLAFTRHGG
jgi:RimJ/RimL family protein N-acetyltransferase